MSLIIVWVGGGGGEGVEPMSTTAKSWRSSIFIHSFSMIFLSSSQVRDLQSANARMTRHVQYVEVSQRKEIENIKAGLAQPIKIVHMATVCNVITHAIQSEKPIHGLFICNFFSLDFSRFFTRCTYSYTFFLNWRRKVANF